MGDMAEYYADYYDWSDPDYVRVDSAIQCRYCRRRNFHWDTHNGQWRLHTPTGQLHTCSEHPSARTPPTPSR